MKRYRLKYDAPAPCSERGWQSECLPVGCGRLGMCIFGQPQKERLQFNEKTLWTGGPCASRPDYAGGNVADGFVHLKKIRRALAEGDAPAVERERKLLVGQREGRGSYQNFGELVLDFAHGEARAYRRELNLNDAVCTVSYTADGTAYRREHFASFAPAALLTKITADRKKALNFTVRLDIAHEPCTLTVQGDTITAGGALSDNGLKYCARLKIATDGRLRAEAEGFRIKDASDCVLILSAGTDYKNEYPHYRGPSPEAAVEQAVEDCAALGWDAVKQKALTYYRSFFDRLDLDLGGKEPDLTTDRLVRAFREDRQNAGRIYYEELLFQYGRYLLLASSAPDESLPANLQGVWNNSNTPAWNCDYHLNVNLQMCYWHAYTANLHETARPMLRYMNGQRAPGRVTAACYHGIRSDGKNPENGWVCHTQNTPFGWTCPGWSFFWGWSPAASSWMMQSCWDYYAFTLDEAALRADIYPMMKENARFWLQNLIYDEKQDRLVSSPSYSPEHGPISVGNAYEQTLIWQLFEDTAKAADTVGEPEFAEKLREAQTKLRPVSVGRTGQIKEWYEEDGWYRKNPLLRRLSYKKHGCQEKHRHASHLLGLYPGSLIRRETPELLEACRTSLYERGFGTAGVNDAGWGKANKICLWARAKDGENAYRVLESLLAKNIAPNLWDLHPPFQLDGNCGYTAGVCELLCYGCDEYLELLPALPRAWRDGSVRGLCARGGYAVDMSWRDGKVTGFQIRGMKTGTVRVRVNGEVRSVQVSEAPQADGGKSSRKV